MSLAACNQPTCTNAHNTVPTTLRLPLMQAHNWEIEAYSRTNEEDLCYD